MQWWPWYGGALTPSINLGWIDVDRLGEGAIQAGYNFHKGGGGGGGGGSMTLINSAGDLSTSVVWFGYMSSVSSQLGQGLGQGGASAQALAQAQAGVRAQIPGQAQAPAPGAAPAVIQPQAAGPVFTFRFQGSGDARSHPERRRRRK